MKHKKPQKFGVVIKRNVQQAVDLAKTVGQWLEENGRSVAITGDVDNLDKSWPNADVVSKESIPETCDMVLVFGGDGTFLSIARRMVNKSIPILGVNLGHLGFLTEFTVDTILDDLERICQGDYHIQERSMLETSVIRNNKSIFSRPVLNDAVINNADIARILDTELMIDGVFAASVKADGMIVSTPTGSTAYSLAAGGPIVHPSVAATTIAAICPHSLTIRPIVVPEETTIEVLVAKKDGKALLTLDGQFGYDLEPGDIVRVTKFTKHGLAVVRPRAREYFDVLRSKLKLGARGEGN